MVSDNQRCQGQLKTKMVSIKKIFLFRVLNIMPYFEIHVKNLLMDMMQVSVKLYSY